MLRKALAVQPSLEECHFLMASALRSLGRTQEAEQEMRIFKALHEVSHFPAATKSMPTPEQEAFWEGCQRLLEQGKEQEALERFRLVNNGQFSYYLLGTLYYNIGRFRDAQRVLTISIEREPNNADSVAWLGRTELANGRLSEAKRPSSKRWRWIRQIKWEQRESG